MGWARRHAAELIVAASAIGASAVVASSARSAPPPMPPIIWLAPDAAASANWVCLTGAAHDPVFVRDGRRIIIVSDDGGMRPAR